MKAPVSIHEKMVKESRKRLKKTISKEWQKKKPIPGKKTKKARSKRVMAILDNKIETLITVREEHWPPYGDFDPDQGYDFVVVQWPGHPEYPHIHIPAQTCIFLKD